MKRSFRMSRVRMKIIYMTVCSMEARWKISFRRIIPSNFLLKKYYFDICSRENYNKPYFSSIVLKRALQKFQQKRAGAFKYDGLYSRLWHHETNKRKGFNPYCQIDFKNNDTDLSLYNSACKKLERRTQVNHRQIKVFQARTRPFRVFAGVNEE